MSSFLNLLCTCFKDFLDCIISFTLLTLELIPSLSNPTENNHLQNASEEGFP